MDENKCVIEAFDEISLSEVIESDKISPPNEVERSTKSPIIVCYTTENQQPDVNTTALDINYNHLSDKHATSEKEDSESESYDRHKRRSLRLTNLKSNLVASGAIFRPPFTPSNSLAKSPNNWRSPRGSIVEPSVGEMRSSSIRPGSRTSSGASGSRAPSLPPVPKNKKYAHVQARTISHSDHKAPESQVRITHKPVKIEAKSKVGSLHNIGHVARGGDKKVPTQKLEFQVKPRINSLANISHVAGGGQNKVPSEKLHFKEKAKPRIESHLDVEKLQKNGKDSARSNNINNSQDK